MAKYRISWMGAFIAPLNVVWRPHLLLILIFEVRNIWKLIRHYLFVAYFIGNGLRFLNRYQREPILITTYLNANFFA